MSGMSLKWPKLYVHTHTHTQSVMKLSGILYKRTKIFERSINVNYIDYD